MKQKILENGVEYSVRTNKKGTQYWYLNNQLHRFPVDEPAPQRPAVIYPDGSRDFYWYGKWYKKENNIVENKIQYHVVTYSKREQHWHIDDYIKHRENGPAIIRDGSQEWCWYDKIHRLDGPAFIRDDGKCFWFYQDEHVDVKSQQEFEQWVKLRAFQ